MQLIIGLGNPGKEYQSTRHNLGENIVLKLLDKYNLKPDYYCKNQCQLAKLNDTLIGTTSTYMNTSGPAIAAAANFFKISPEDILIIHDDLDIRVGEWKLQFDRSPAGHNGIKSTVDALGTQSFWRLRVGIDHPRNSQNPALPVDEYVTQAFTSDEKVQIDRTIDKIVADFDNIIAPFMGP